MNCEIDGYSVNYSIFGDGRRVCVVLQGWGTNCEIYRSIAELLKDKYKVVLFDFPGFGKSTEPREPWDVSGYAEFFLKLMEKLDIKEATLIGHSYGGRVIIKLASDPLVRFNIERIVLIDSAGVLPKKTLLQKYRIKRYKLLKRLASVKLFYNMCPEFIEAWKSTQGSADYKNASPVMKQCLVKAVNEDLTELFPLIKQEVLLVWGDKDTATPLKDAKLMEQKMNNAGLAVIEGTGHFSFLEAPTVFAGILKNYFSL